jgi:hypothetical protein
MLFTKQWGVKSLGMPLAGKQIAEEVIDIHPFEFIHALPVLIHYYAPDEFDEVKHTLITFQEITEEEAEMWRRNKDGQKNE